MNSYTLVSMILPASARLRGRLSAVSAPRISFSSAALRAQSALTASHRAPVSAKTMLSPGCELYWALPHGVVILLIFAGHAVGRVELPRWMDSVVLAHAMSACVYKRTEVLNFSQRWIEDAEMNS